MSVDDLLPANLPMLVSRSEARTLLQDAIADGKAILLKRTPSDLREDTPKARALKFALKAWGTKASDAMTTCFGTEGTTAIKSTSLSYTTLEKAKQKVRLRLELEPHDRAVFERPLDHTGGAGTVAAGIPVSDHS